MCYETEIWKKLDNDLAITLRNSLRGSLESKTALHSEIIYNECTGRFGLGGKRKEATPSAKSRREKEILQLVKDRRALRKAWKKAKEYQKEGLKALWNDIRERLASLRRAERIRKRRKRKESQRSKFLKNPFRMARSLLED